VNLALRCSLIAAHLVDRANHVSNWSIWVVKGAFGEG